MPEIEYEAIYAVIRKSLSRNFHPEIISYSDKRERAWEVVDRLAKEIITDLENDFTKVYRQDSVDKDGNVALVTISYQKIGFFYSGSLVEDSVIYYEQVVSSYVKDDMETEN